jgi:hypothetical protein
MDRRTLLRTVGVVGAIGAAGCLSRDDTTPGRTETTTRDGTTAAGQAETATAACESTPPPSPSTGEGLPDPEPYPDLTSALNPESTREYAESFETAHRHNRVLANLAADGNCVRNLGASVTESDVTQTRSGYEVTVTTRASYTGEQCPSETATPLPHVDLGRKSVTYTVTRRSLVREETTVACHG